MEFFCIGSIFVVIIAFINSALKSRKKTPRPLTKKEKETNEWVVNYFREKEESIKRKQLGKKVEEK